jgi:hypothetical protein
MSDWTSALEEAYASAPADEFVVSTLELIHQAFVDDENNADSIRVVLDENPWDLELEEGAALFGGETKTFEPLAIEVSLPEQSDANLGSLRLSLDNVPRDVWTKMQAAARIRASAQLIYREWIATKNPLTQEYSVVGAPDMVIGGLTVKVISASILRIEGTATFVDLLNKKFPRRMFSRDDFPGLFGGA